MGEEMRALRSTNRLLQNSHGDIRYSIGNGVSNQRSSTHDPWTRTMTWGLPEGVGYAGWRGAKGKIRTTVIA